MCIINRNISTSVSHINIFQLVALACQANSIFRSCLQIINIQHKAIAFGNSRAIVFIITSTLSVQACCSSLNCTVIQANVISSSKLRRRSLDIATANDYINAIKRYFFCSRELTASHNNIMIGCLEGYILRADISICTNAHISFFVDNANIAGCLQLVSQNYFILLACSIIVYN